MFDVLDRDTCWSDCNWYNAIIFTDGEKNYVDIIKNWNGGATRIVAGETDITSFPYFANAQIMIRYVCDVITHNLSRDFNASEVFPVEEESRDRESIYDKMVDDESWKALND